MPEISPIILEVCGVSCSRISDAEPLSPVRGVSLAIQAKGLNLLTGNGHGDENLLLRLLGLLETPDEGEIFFHGEATRELPEELRTDLRSQRYGFLFAEPFLLPAFSVVENIAMPLFKISGVGADEAQTRTQAMLEFAGMGDFGEASVDQLTSGGRHRVSLARALVNQPEILIIENVDASMTGVELGAFMDLIQRASSEFGTTAIFTARDRNLPNFAGRVIELADGAVAHDSHPVVKNGGAAV